MSTPLKMPPIGVMPQTIWKKKAHLFGPRPGEYRLQALTDATFRYRAAGLEPDPEWLQEWAVIVACYLIIDAPGYY